jgi:hypothetical protein
VALVLVEVGADEGGEARSAFGLRESTLVEVMSPSILSSERIYLFKRFYDFVEPQTRGKNENHIFKKKNNPSNCNPKESMGD